MRHPAWKLGSGIMITVQSIVYRVSLANPCMQGKGYPDLATRQLVKNISDKLLPTYALVMD
jgi:hypothetical protein